MMVAKITTTLSREIVHVLPLAACLGTTFRNDTLEIVANVLWENQEEEKLLSSNDDDNDDNDKDGKVTHALQDVMKEPTSLWDRDTWLAACVPEGLLTPYGDDQHKWVHDKFREAALAMIVPEKLSAFKFRVGQVMMQHLYKDDLDRSVFTVADLLNADPQRKVKNRQQRLEMAEINLKAAQAAMASASFRQAVEYLEVGFVRLPPNAWHRHYVLALEMHSCAAESCFCIGNSEKVEAHSALSTKKTRR